MYRLVVKSVNSDHIASADRWHKQTSFVVIAALNVKASLGKLCLTQTIDSNFTLNQYV